MREKSSTIVFLFLSKNGTFNPCFHIQIATWKLTNSFHSVLLKGAASGEINMKNCTTIPVLICLFTNYFSGR